MEYPLFFIYMYVNILPFVGGFIHEHFPVCFAALNMLLCMTMFTAFFGGLFFVSSVFVSGIPLLYTIPPLINNIFVNYFASYAAETTTPVVAVPFSDIPPFEEEVFNFFPFYHGGLFIRSFLCAWASEVGSIGKIFFNFISFGY